MAGIGFELKKLFRRKGLFASLRAYGYAGIILSLIHISEPTRQRIRSRMPSSA